MKFRTHELFLGVFLATAIFAMGMLFAPARSVLGPPQHGAEETSWLLKDAAGFFTFLLVLVGGIQAYLFLRQLKLIDESLSPAKDAAEAAGQAAIAAKTNAQAVIEAERARFYVVINSHTLDKIVHAAMFYPHSPEMALGNNVGVEYVLKNYGKTPAIYRENSHGITMSSRPPDPVYSVSEQIPSQNMIEPGAVTDTQICADVVPIDSIGDALPILRGETHLWFFGSIDYTDVFGQQRTDRFLFRYVQLAGKWRFQPYDYKHYNSSSVPFHRAA